MVVPAFGFSVGDFVAATQLIAKAAKSLNEASGASSRYRQAAVELNQLLALLRRIQGLDTDNVAPHIVEKIQLCSHACHVPLAQFLRRLEKFESLSDNTATPSGVATLAKSARKIKFALLVEPELAKLRASLAPQLATIEILLQLNSTEQVAGVQKTADQTCGELKLLLSRVDDLKSRLDQSRDQAADVRMLAEGFAAQSLHHDHSLMVSANTTQSNTDEILAKVCLQEAALSALLQKIDERLTPTLPPMPSNRDTPHQRLDASKITPNDEPPLSDCQTDAPSIEHKQAQQLALAVRSGLTDVLLLLLSLVPAIRRFFRCLLAIPAAPTLLLESNINLEDALGRMLSLPFEHFRYWPVLEARLREAFLGLPGEEKVARMQYHIIGLHAGGNSVLTKEIWSNAVKPGSKLAMSMLYQASGEDRICPRCSFMNSSSGRDAWLTCIACNLTYRMLGSRPKSSDTSGSSGSKAKRAVELGDIMDLVDYLDPEMLEPFPREEMVSREMMHFKRIHLIGHVVGPSQSPIKHVNAHDHQIDTEQENTSSITDLVNESVQDGESEAIRPEATVVAGLPESYLARGTTVDSARRGEEIETRYSGSDLTWMPKPRSSSQDSGWSTTVAIDGDGQFRVPEVDIGSEKTAAAFVGEPTAEKHAQRSETAHILQPDFPERWRAPSTSAGPARLDTKVKPKGILKKPTEKFPDNPNFMREGVAPLKDASKEGIPSGARWTRIDRRLVNPAALEEAKERFEERHDCVVVLRVLTKQEIQRLADRTKEIREEREAQEQEDGEESEEYEYEQGPSGSPRVRRRDVETTV